MFSNPAVIEASREFVCVRIESYESEANQEIVRSYLNGRFENTAFCLLAPDGKTRLTRSHRGPSHLFPRTEDLVAALERIADDYRPRAQLAGAPVPDFSSFKLALNVASADQRVLVLLTGQKEALSTAEQRLRKLAWHPKVQGRFHFDVDPGEAWKAPLSLEAPAAAGIYLIKPHPFGLSGEVLKRLPLDAGDQHVMSALVAANRTFAATTEKKVYSEHVGEGRRRGLAIDFGMPFGEDRDGDGVIDHRGGRRPRR